MYNREGGRGLYISSILNRAAIMQLPRFQHGIVSQLCENSSRFLACPRPGHHTSGRTAAASHFCHAPNWDCVMHYGVHEHIVS
jgi:hypothetical protein